MCNYTATLPPHSIADYNYIHNMAMKFIHLYTPPMRSSAPLSAHQFHGARSLPLALRVLAAREPEVSVRMMEHAE